ncbi:hypothetical protein AAKU58_000256 [Oxalobacteraceae bacterium GrIS 1.18]
MREIVQNVALWQFLHLRPEALALSELMAI